MKPTPSEARKMTPGAGMQLNLRERSGIPARDGRLQPITETAAPQLLHQERGRAAGAVLLRIVTVIVAAIRNSVAGVRLDGSVRGLRSRAIPPFLGPAPGGAAVPNQAASPRLDAFYTA